MESDAAAHQRVVKFDAAQAARYFPVSAELEKKFS
jgi:hypothetical protein